MSEDYDELVAIQEDAIYGEGGAEEEGEEDYDLLSEEGIDPHEQKAYRFIPGTCILCAGTCFVRNVLCGKCAKKYGKYATWPEWLKELSRGRDRERYRLKNIRRPVFCAYNRFHTILLRQFPLTKGSFNASPSQEMRSANKQEVSFELALGV